MGRMKDRRIEEEQRGWFSVPGKFTCPECFENDFLRKLVRDNATASVCDFCGMTAEELAGDPTELIAAPFDIIMQSIAEGLNFEWNNADDEGIIYESAEGGYQADTMDSYDLVWEFVCPANDTIAKQIIKALPDQVWVRRRYYSLSQDEALWYGWTDFCNLVKHENRYMFHLRQRKTA
jgi:transcription elongation factor Elf1